MHFLDGSWRTDYFIEPKVYPNIADTYSKGDVIDIKVSTKMKVTFVGGLPGLETVQAGTLKFDVGSCAKLSLGKRQSL